MIRKTVIASLFAVAACTGTDAVQRDMSNTVDFTAPANCDLAPFNGEMACDFVSEEGRNRRIILDFITHDDPEAGAEMASMNGAEKTEWFQQNITQIDARRRAAMPAGYRQINYAILPASQTPPGFAACAKSREELPVRSGERGDGIELHCWGPGPEANSFSQLLFSYIEYNDPGTPVSASFERDANAVLSTIRVVRR